MTHPYVDHACSLTRPVARWLAFPVQICRQDTAGVLERHAHDICHDIWHISGPNIAF